MNSLSNLGYEYTVRMFESIDNIVKKNNKDHYVWCGLNFSSAYKRQMHYELMNVGYFEQLEKNSSNLEVINSDHYSILADMFPTVAISIKSQFSVFYIKNKLKRIKIVRLLYDFIFRKKNMFSNNVIGGKIALIVLHIKFIRFFEEIYKKMDGAIFVICGDYSRSIEYCKKNGYSFVSYNRTIFHDDKIQKEYLYDLVICYKSIEQFFSRYVFNVYVVPEGDAALYEIINLYAGKNSGSCICIQHGWDPMFFTGFRDMHYTSFLSWGNELSSMLKKYNPLQKFENVGCHVHNVNLEKSISRKIAFFLQPTCPIVSKQDIDEFIRLIVSVAENNKDIIVSVREHPSMQLDNYLVERLIKNDNVSIENSDTHTLSDVLSEAILSICIYSTVIVDSIDFLTIPIMVNTSGLEHYVPNINEIGIGFEVYSAVEAAEVISRILNDYELEQAYISRIKEYKDMYYIANGEAAINNVVNSIERKSAMSEIS